MQPLSVHGLIVAPQLLPEESGRVYDPQDGLTHAKKVYTVAKGKFEGGRRS